MDYMVGKIADSSSYFSKWHLKWHDLQMIRRDNTRSIQSPNFTLLIGTCCFAIQMKLLTKDREITCVLKLLKLSSTDVIRPIQLCVDGMLKWIRSEWTNDEEPYLEFTFCCSMLSEVVVISCDIWNNSMGALRSMKSVEDSSSKSRFEDLSIPPVEKTKEEDETPRSKSAAKLVGDLKEILLSEKDSDVILEVEGKEFKAHRLILGMRSPVFAAMFEHEMREKNSGVVDIEDCDKETFFDFLHYTYTGTVEKLSSENAPGLYVAADKYQLLELKEECLEYMKKNVSVENFCDFMTISLRHHETELTRIATQFFLEKAASFVVTTNWMTFLAENVVAGNELIVKLTANRGTK